MGQVIELNKVIADLEPSFEEQAQIHGIVNFKSESLYALQVLKANNYLTSIAQKNPESLKNAILNSAAMGITLNPAQKLGYLVPRGDAVILDISYMGLVQIACDVGSILWAQAELVREKDEFIFNGVGTRPTHKMEPFTERGAVIGAYVVAKTADGEFLVDMMSLTEIHSIRDRSEAWKAFQAKKIKSCPWVTDEGEMSKKTVVKRAFKMWPRTEKSERLAKAIDYTNKYEGITFEAEYRSIDVTAKQSNEITELLGKIGKDEKAFIGYFKEVAKRPDIEKISDLTKSEADQAIIQLKQFAKAPPKTPNGANSKENLEA